MRDDRLEQMAGVLRAKYERESQIIRSVLAEENELRASLDRLDARVRENHQACRGEHMIATAHASLLWQEWASRTRANLNTELARVMARKLEVQERVRTAFGRQHAVSVMQAARKASREKQREKRRIETLLSLQ